MGGVTKQNREAPEVDHDLIVDRIYQVALEPSALDDFIEFWHTSGLARHFENSQNAEIAEQVASYQTHLERAQSILQRGESAEIDLAQYLQPYDRLAAFIVGRSLVVEACNSGAFATFRIEAGDRWIGLRCPRRCR